MDREKLSADLKKIVDDAVKSAFERGYVEGQRRTLEIIAGVLKGDDGFVSVANPNNELFQHVVKALREGLVYKEALEEPTTWRNPNVREYTAGVDFGKDDVGKAVVVGPDGKVYPAKPGREKP